MKTISFLKKQLILMAAVLTAGVTMSFNSSSDTEKAGTVHYYVSNSMAPGAFSNVANWSTTNANGECVTEQDARPCKVIVPDGTTLSSVLAGKNNSQVLDISDGYKPEP